MSTASALTPIGARPYVLRCCMDVWRDPRDLNERCPIKIVDPFLFSLDIRNAMGRFHLPMSWNSPTDSGEPSPRDGSAPSSDWGQAFERFFLPEQRHHSAVDERFLISPRECPRETRTIGQTRGRELRDLPSECLVFAKRTLGIERR